ncbi:phage tail tube protein [Defluviimonas aestuarii]|uniref:phage tail tube protein n=1 Tax=Albidovulum aestuarii TaxID=1130726 RepID=UPI00249A9B2F|nr:phage tail tube protein [Defluviimonas aestuarii]MDI3335865.1 phage tail tube protein [Defluviimonas aestuarii]
MAAPVTAKYEQLVLEVETTTPGTYAKLCGIMGFSINREAQVDRVEVPADCDDESLPYSVEKQVRSTEYVVEGEAVWAQQSHETVLQWFRSGTTKNIRIQHVNAASGDVEYESGAALLTQLNHQRSKGQKVTASIRAEFDGTPTTTDKV